MKTILIIGIGAGHPEHLTIQAVNAMNRAQVFFLLDKGPVKHALGDLRRELCRQYVHHDNYRIVQAQSPERLRDDDAYAASVAALNGDKQALFERLIDSQMHEDECGAFLVWGDPALYDSTLRILQAIQAQGRLAFEVVVIPGITSVQALAAAHQVPLNRIGESLQITTGRRLAQGYPSQADTVVVMLDAQDTYLRYAAQDLDIYWGAYVGTPDELLIAGKLAEVGEQIRQVREAARLRHGWIMDTYLLRAAPTGG
ncbi:MAG: precorrin-6A synthase (deacetylating) [Pseudomonas sp.]|nr:precorrin-6A synthase (deacetylating) [Pseudomonas sp.]